jgi:hypothetical protein
MGCAGFNGLTEVTWPLVSVNPPGWFIHEFTAITDIAPASVHVRRAAACS